MLLRIVAIEFAQLHVLTDAGFVVGMCVAGKALSEMEAKPPSATKGGF